MTVSGMLPDLALPSPQQHSENVTCRRRGQHELRRQRKTKRQRWSSERLRSKPGGLRSGKESLQGRQ